MQTNIADKAEQCRFFIILIDGNRCSPEQGHPCEIVCFLLPQKLLKKIHYWQMGRHNNPRSMLMEKQRY